MLGLACWVALASVGAVGDALPLVNVWKQVTAVSCSQLAPDPMGRQRIIVDFPPPDLPTHTHTHARTHTHTHR